MFKTIAAFAVMTIFATPALAVCAGNQVEVFSCSFGHKQVELCMTTQDQSVTYRFGPQNAPELELTRDFDEIEMRPWNGIGSMKWDMVAVPSGTFTYELHWSKDRQDIFPIGGIVVSRGTQTLASLACQIDDETSAYVFELQTLSDAMQEDGFCRSGSSDLLRQGPCS